MSKDKNTEINIQEEKSIEKKASISDAILAIGKSEAKEIRKKADKEAKEIESKLINDAKKEADEIILKAKVEADGLLKSQEMSHELAKRQAMLVAKSKMMDKLFDNAYEKIKTLSEKEFLEFIINLLKDEKYEGTEEIKVNKNDYKLYEKLIPKVNKELKTNFILSKDPVNIDSGFLIIGKYYDLNFDFMEIIELVRKKYETKLSEELFN